MTAHLQLVRPNNENRSVRARRRTPTRLTVKIGHLECGPSVGRTGLPLSSEFERQFNCAGHRGTLFPRHCSPIAISLSTITRSQLIVTCLWR